MTNDVLNIFLFGGLLGSLLTRKAGVSKLVFMAGLSERIESPITTPSDTRII